MISAIAAPKPNGNNNSSTANNIFIRRHQFPKHYRIPSNPIEESVYTLIRPKRDVPPPLFKSRFAATVKTEKGSIIATADRLRKAGRAFNSIEQSPIVNTAIGGGGGATSILVGTPYDEEDSVRNVIKTSKPSSTGLYATIHKSNKTKLPSPLSKQQSQKYYKSKKRSNEPKVKVIRRSETPEEIVKNAISKAAEADNIKRQKSAAIMKKTSYSSTSATTTSSTANNNSMHADTTVSPPPVPEEDETLARLLQATSLKQNNNNSNKNHLASAPPVVEEEDFATNSSRVSSWNTSSATFLHHKTEEDVTASSIKRMAMPEHERVAILAGFKSNWDKLNKEFQRMPISSKRMGRKVYLEKQLSMIEQNIKEFERL